MLLTISLTYLNFLLTYKIMSYDWPVPNTKFYGKSLIP